MNAPDSAERPVYRHDVRIPYADVDRMGFVYYANYLVYFEMARNEILRDAGTPYRELEARGVMLPVLEAHCEYHQSARYDDLITVFSTCTGRRGPRLRIAYEVKREDDLLATGHTVHVCMSPTGKVLRPPPELRAVFDRETCND